MKIGDVYTRELHKDAYINLWKKGIYSEISIEPSILEDNTLEVTLTIVDKWTLIIAPIFFVSSGSIAGGYAFLEQNLFGYGKSLISVGIYGNYEASFDLIYIDKEVNNSNFYLSVVNQFDISQYTQSSYGFSDMYNIENRKVNTTVRKTQGLRYKFSSTLAYNVNKNFSPYITPGFGIFDNNIGLDETYESTDNRYKSEIAVPMSIGMKYNTLQPFGLLQKGFYTRTNYLVSTYTSLGYFYNAISLESVYYVGLGKKDRQTISFFLDGMYGNVSSLYLKNLGGKDTSRTISNSSINTNKYIASSIEHSIVVWENKFVGFVVSYGADASVYEVYDYDYSPKLNGGVFISNGIILNKVAIPLAKLIVGYNVVGEYVNITFSIGSR